MHAAAIRPLVINETAAIGRQMGAGINDPAVFQRQPGHGTGLRVPAAALKQLIINRTIITWVHGLSGSAAQQERESIAFLPDPLYFMCTHT